MKLAVVAAALLVLTVPAFAAGAPAKKWYLTVNIYPMANNGDTHWDNPNTAHLNHAFDTRGECLARWRIFRKECRGLILDYNKFGFSVTKYTGVCRRLRQQPEPLLASGISEGEIEYFPRNAIEGVRKEIECEK